MKATPAPIRIHGGACQLGGAGNGDNKAPCHQPRTGRDDEDDDEHNEGQSGGKVDEPRDGIDILRGQGSGDPERQAADVGEWQVGEVSDGRCAEGLHDKENEDRCFDRKARSDQDP